MKWSNYRVIVRFIETGVESQVTVQAVSKADALWRAVHKRLDTRYEALSAVKLD
jgi:hypothetical protein